jgi:hypothetical protein
MKPVFNIGDRVRIKQTAEAIRINKGYGFDLGKVYQVKQVEPSFAEPFRYYLNTEPAANFTAEQLTREGS